MKNRKKEKISKLKKRLITILIVIAFIMLAIFIQRLIYHKIDEENPVSKVKNNTSEPVAEENKTEEPKEEKELVDDGEIKVVPTMNDEILGNAAWCGTLQLAWNDLMEKSGGELIFDPEITMATNLNKKDFTKENVSEDDYYQTYGLQTKKLKEKIEKNLKDKFDETSDILDDFQWYDTEKEAGSTYFFYAILKKVFNFEYVFEDLDDGIFENGKYKDVKYFGVTTSTDERVREQIRILYYNNDEDFAVSLKTKEGEDIILCNNPDGKNFKEIYDNINNKNKQYSGMRILEDIDDFKMPNLKFDLKETYDEFAGKSFTTENGSTGSINQMVQTIELELNKKGGKLKSEAAISADITSAIEEPKTPKHLYLDDSFVMFLVEEDKDTPYFAVKISDISKFQ